MNKISLTFTVNQQDLKNTTKNLRLASGTVDYVDATFELGDNWDSFDSVRAIWTKRTDAYSTVLDAYGYCKVPTELLADKGTIKVNLVGSITEEIEGEEVLTDRLTTFSTTALSVSQLVPLEGGETSPLTPSQFEQFVYVVQGYSEDAVTAKEGAETAQGLAETAQSGAESAMASAVEAKESAQDYAEDASGSADSASQSATASQGFASDAETYAGQASTSADNASASATSASGYADDAQGYASDANGYAETASSEADRAEDAREAIEDMTVSAHAETGTTPTVTKTIVSDVVNLDFGLVRGEKGDTGDTGPAGPQGIQGEPGETGATPDFTIGTVTTLAPGSQATATITGTDEDPVLNLGIPKGDPGEVTEADLLKLAVHDETSGSIVSFPDGSDGFPMDSLQVSIEPVQAGSGTPSPDNVRPITGWDEVNTVVCGVNQWDEEWEVGGISASTGLPDSSTDRIRAKNYIPVVSGTSLYFKAGENGQTAWQTVGWFYDSDKNPIGTVFYRRNAVLAVPTGAKYVRFAVTGGYGTTYNHDISINYPSTDQDYHAYQGRTITTDLGRTVYGGTLDVVTGELVVDRAMVDLGTLTWSLSTAGVFITTSLNKANAYVGDYYCSNYPYMGTTTSNTGAYNKGNNTLSLYTGEDRRVYIRDDLYTDASDFTSAMNGVQLVYPLATPTTYQLTPTEIDSLLGTNNVWCDAGDVYVKYVADTKLYILKVVQ